MMNRVLAVALFALFALSLAAVPLAASAQSAPTFIPLTPAVGALYKPDSGPAPHVGIVVMHRTANYLNHPACTEFSKRGFMVLCMNSRYVGNEELVRFETMALDVKAGVQFLRKQPGITKVLLFGHSGGGPTMSFYQAVAENGPGYCNKPNKLVKCTDELAALPRADGIIFADSHPGNPANVVRGLNPSVIDESDPPAKRVIADLDPFDPKNGFNPNGASHYSADFQKRYYAAQAARMNKLIDLALAKIAKMSAGDYGYPDDDVLPIPRGGNPGSGPGASAALFNFDPDIAGIFNTVRPEKLIKNDGTVVTQPIKSVYVADPHLAIVHLTFGGGSKLLSLRSFLSANATRGTNSLDGIDDCSSNNSTVCAVQSISVPELFLAMGAFEFVRDVEHEYDLASTKDKDFAVVEGALHGFTPCTACETTPGQYSNTMKNLFDYAAAWINKRY
jgi:pimeloyl-ACP methyl ester carboxylesterase